MNAPATTAPLPDTPEARRYNRIRRWLGVADVGVGVLLLVALLVTGGSGVLRDFAYRAAFQSYVLAVILYVLELLFLAKLFGVGLDYYGFRLEHRFQLSNQKLWSWTKDQFKEFLVGVVLAGIVAEVLYFIIRQSPQHWWLVAWAASLECLSCSATRAGSAVSNFLQV